MMSAFRRSHPAAQVRAAPLEDILADIVIRNLDDTDIGDIVALDEKLGGEYRPEVWERRIGYYLRRDPECSAVAELDGRVVGFMLGEVRSGEFGLEEPAGWIEVVGVDPEVRGAAVGRRLAEAMFDSFRLRGASRVRTLVHDSVPDVAGFFRSLGFAAEPLTALIKNL